MTDYIDPIEVATEAFQRTAMLGESEGAKVYEEDGSTVIGWDVIAPGIRAACTDLLATLLEAAHSDSVLIEKVKCEACGGVGYEKVRFHPFIKEYKASPCPTCNGKGHSYRMSGMELANPGITVQQYRRIPPKEDTDAD